MDEKVILDQKWQKILQRAWLFRYIPFLEFVLVSGSMALGNPHRDSDFDVMISARTGRLYTNRFSCLLFFKFFGWRRNLHKPRDGFCFNCFFTKSSYYLDPPRNYYSKSLYANLVPIFGDENLINKFFITNLSWLGQVTRFSNKDMRYLFKNKSSVATLVEKIFSKRAGDCLEKLLKWWQVNKIKKNLISFKANDNSRIIFNDNRVELCLSLKNNLD